MKLELETIFELYRKLHEIFIFNYKTNVHFKCVKTNIDDLRYNEANASFASVGISFHSLIAWF